jgi:cell shape-determining protein MreC
MSNIFPEGILIGTVSRIGIGHDLFFKPVQLTPGVHVNQLLSVYVLFSSDTSKPMTIPLNDARWNNAEESTP